MSRIEIIISAVACAGIVIVARYITNTHVRAKTGLIQAKGTALGVIPVWVSGLYLVGLAGFIGIACYSFFFVGWATALLVCGIYLITELVKSELFERRKWFGRQRKIPVVFTSEENEAIEKNRAVFNSFTPEGKVLWLDPKAANATDAIGLVDHVADLARRIDDESFPKEQKLRLLDQAIKTQSKVCALHSLPFYLYLWADLYDLSGRTDEAERLYRLFLTAQNEFKPDNVDSASLKYLATKSWFDLADAMKVAKTRVGIRV